MNRLVIARPYALGAVLASLIMGVPAISAQEPDEAQQVVIHLKHFSDNLHAVTMALKLGSAVQKEGGQVALMLDLEGVRLADVRQPQDLRWGSETPIGTYYEAFVKGGGKVMVCPHCAHAAGMKEKDLRAGAKIGTEDDLAQLIRDADKILDY